MTQPVTAFDDALALVRSLGLREISGGDGTADPFAQFGLNPDGTPKAADTPAGDDKKPVEPAIPVAVQQRLEKAEATLAKMTTEHASLAQKAALLDRLSSAITGEKLPDPNAAGNEKIWGELKDVLRSSSPAFYKLLLAVEKDPNLLEKLQRGQEALTVGTLATLNSSAHDAVMAAAKTFYKGATDAELPEIVLPFEKTITDIINANQTLKARFIAGEAQAVAKEIFERLLKPHASMRIRSKQERTRSSDLPKAPPRGGAGTGTSSPDAGDDKAPLIRSLGKDGKRVFDLKTPQGRAAFHKTVINRKLDAMSGRDDD